MDQRRTLDEKLEDASEKLAAAKAALDRSGELAERAHEMGGGIPGFGASGNQRAARQVRSAHDTAQRAWKEATERVSYWSDKVKRLEYRKAEVERVPLTREDIKGATHVRIGRFWHKVVRVNAKTVSVDSGYSWTDRYEFSKVHEARTIVGGSMEDSVHG
ncbi:hypothetical protein DEI99_005385 [Curtobacterium sp. MCLR17_036]|uniref:hypothetical protein n=1 Tax=Curtobacterium sp. MCLR17_036 TaxID=2175620 RepID=UPI0011B80165|nr:hypothetical protein [Curtobacterium sp. MCLR17_036]WIE65972.1 hypothetical protein DEI99_005385 [Curtobacterium sp. MCLR17_036]